MKSVKVSTHIQAPPDVVFQQVTDLHNAAERITAIQKLEVLTDGPIGVGTRFRETRKMFGRECTEEMEIVDFRSGESYTTEAHSCGCLYRADIRVFPDADGTRLEMEMFTTPRSTGAKIFAPVMGLMFSGAMRKCLQADFDDIRRNCEGGVALA